MGGTILKSLFLWLTTKSRVGASNRQIVSIGSLPASEEYTIKKSHVGNEQESYSSEELDATLKDLGKVRKREYSHETPKPQKAQSIDLMYLSAQTAKGTATNTAVSSYSSPL